MQLVSILRLGPGHLAAVPSSPLAIRPCIQGRATDHLCCPNVLNNLTKILKNPEKVEKQKIDVLAICFSF